MEDLRLGVIPHNRLGNARRPSELFSSICVSVRAYPTNPEPLN